MGSIDSESPENGHWDQIRSVSLHRLDQLSTAYCTCGETIESDNVLLIVCNDEGTGVLSLIPACSPAEPGVQLFAAAVERVKFVMWGYRLRGKLRH